YNGKKQYFRAPENTDVIRSEQLLNVTGASIGPESPLLLYDIREEAGRLIFKVETAQHFAKHQTEVDDQKYDNETGRYLYDIPQDEDDDKTT
ncbi:hypothetical protein FQN53_007829, partial [Emmonsiellopsis sp. PD_33]